MIETTTTPVTPRLFWQHQDNGWHSLIRNTDAGEMVILVLTDADYKAVTNIARLAELLEALMQIANDWTHETPALPAEHARKIALAAIAKAKSNHA